MLPSKVNRFSLSTETIWETLRCSGVGNFCTLWYFSNVKVRYLSCIALIYRAFCILSQHNHTLSIKLVSRDKKSWPNWSYIMSRNIVWTFATWSFQSTTSFYDVMLQTRFVASWKHSWEWRSIKQACSRYIITFFNHSRSWPASLFFTMSYILAFFHGGGGKGAPP